MALETGDVLDILDPMSHLLSHQGHRWSWPARVRGVAAGQRTKLALGGEAGLAAFLSLHSLGSLSMTSC